MDGNRTAALVGAVGGAGATRLSIEVGATLARAGRDVAVLDAAYATQGLSQYAPGRIDPDVTALVTGDGSEADDPAASLADALVDLDVETEGRLAICPAYAPFERIARAKTPAAARAFERVLGAAADEFDHAVADAPPVAANQAVAAVTAVDRVGVVAPPTDRGTDALQRAHGRLSDVGVENRIVVGNRVDAEMPDADVTVPESDATAVADAPVSQAGAGPFAPAVAEAAATLFDASLDLPFADGLVDAARRRLG